MLNHLNVLSNVLFFCSSHGSFKVHILSCSTFFSNNVYTGMKNVGLRSQTATSAYITADFLKQVNDVFDLLNVRVYGKKVASPIAGDSIQHLKILSDMKVDAEPWHVIVKGMKY